MKQPQDKPIGKQTHRASERNLQNKSDIFSMYIQSHCQLVNKTIKKQQCNEKNMPADPDNRASTDTL